MTRTTIMALTVLMGLGFAPAMAQDDGAKPEAKPEAEKPEADKPETRPEHRQNRRGRRGFGGEQMQEQLGLSDEQVKKLDSIRGEMRDAFRKMREEGGGFDREAMSEMREKMTSKMNEILTPDQQKKYEEMRSRQRERWGRRGRGGEGMGRRRRGNNPARLRESSVKALNLGEEAAAVVLPVLDKILAAQTEAREGLRTRREALQEKAVGDVTSDELTAQLVSFRKARKEARAKIEVARAELQELLTLQQEAKLVALGILE